jgi:hypothetical protein
MTDFDNPHNRALIEKYEKTERDRERARQIAHQAGLGPIKTLQQLAQEAYESYGGNWVTV